MSELAESNVHRRDAWICLALVALTWAVFFQVANFDFVNLDDGVYVAENQNVLSGLTWSGFVWSFSRAATALTGNWHPLTWLSLMMDAQFFGVRPGGYHLMNVVWHTANVLLLYAVLTEMTGARWRSAFVTALFAVHPLHVESVAWVSERKDVLSTFFGLITLWAYVRYAGRPRLSLYLVALTAFVLSLMSKQMLVTLPCLLLLLDYWPLKRLPSDDGDATKGDAPAVTSSYPVQLAETCRFSQKNWPRLVWEKLPLFAVTVVFCVIAVRGQEQGKAVISLEEYTLDLRAGNAVTVYVIYMIKTVWPTGLACFYPKLESIALGDVAVSLVVLLLVTGVAMIQVRRHPYLLVGWLWYLGTLVPVIGLVKVGLPRMADRFTYFPGVGLFVAATWLFAALLPHGDGWRRFVGAIAVTILLALAAVSIVQTAYWKDSITIFERAVAVTKRNDMAHYNLGDIAYEEGRINAAIYHFTEVVRIHPRDAEAHNGLGLALTQVQRFDEAAHHFGESLRIDPQNADVHNNLGLALHRLGLSLRRQQHLNAAARQFEEAVSLDETVSWFHINLGNVLDDLQRYDEAADAYRRAIAIDPRNSAIHNNLALAHWRLEQYESAFDHFQQALSINPDDGMTHFNLARLLLQRGQPERADQHFRMALQRMPELAEEIERVQRARKE